MNILESLQFTQLAQPTITKKLLLITNDLLNWNWSVQKSLDVLNLKIIGASLEEGLASLQAKNAPALIILDFKLAGPAIYKACQRIRQNSTAPIVLVLNSSEKASFLAYLEAGADDYLPTSFTNTEFLAKLETILARSDYSQLPDFLIRLSWGTLTVDCIRHAVEVAGETQPLTNTEYCLLCYLLANPGRLLTYKQLLGKVWGTAYLDKTDYLRACIRRLQAKFKLNISIQAVPGIGYSLQFPQTE